MRKGIFVLLIFILVFLSSFIFKGPLKNISTFKFVFRSQGLSQIVDGNLRGVKGDFSIYIEDLGDGEKYSLRPNDIFPAASLYKLYLMAAVLKEVELTSEVTMQTKLSASKAHLVEVYGGVDTGYEEAPENISYTIEEALTRIGRVSDNFASIMLAEKIGWDKVSDSTSSLTVADFFKKLYRQEIVNANVSGKLIEFLSLNQLNNRIPAGLPEGMRVIHKTGELARVRHDAGIVYLPGREYVIVLMSQNLQYEDGGVEVLAKISKEVYEYFKSK